MKIHSINSASNSILKRVRSLHERSSREKLGLFLLEGAKLLSEARQNDVALSDVIVSKSYLTSGFSAEDHLDFDEITVVDDKLFRELHTTATGCGIVAVAKMKSASLQDCFKGNQTLLAIAEAVQDPGNLGTMIRAALAFGATGLVATVGSVDAFNPKVVRSAMGASFSLPVITGITIEDLVGRLKEERIRIVGLETRANKPIWEVDMTQALAFLFGNEGNGLTTRASQLADELVTIPMNGATESLNVAVSSAVVLFECARQRTFAKR